MFNKYLAILNEVALIKQIAVGLVIGVLLALTVPQAVPVVAIFGDLFVKALKGVAPVLVFFLVMNAPARKLYRYSGMGCNLRSGYEHGC